MTASQTRDARDDKRFVFHATPVRRVAVAILRAAFGPIMRMEVEGRHHVPAEGPVILAANHVTNLDVFPMQFSLSRPIFFMGKAELFRFAPMDWILRELGGFPVYRGERDEWAMRHARCVLENGQVLGMFPEGTRSKGRGLGPARPGTARLAIDAGSPIVPLAVLGSSHFFRRFPQRTRVRLRYLPMLVPEPSDTPQELTDRLMRTLAAALPAGMGGIYAGAGAGLTSPSAR